MGLFSKDKKEEKSGLPPMPPAPTSALSMSAPASPESSMQDIGKLETPSIPGIDSSFNDIKSQVVSSSEKNNLNSETLNNSDSSTDLTVSNEENNELNSEDSDSLFDISGIDMPNLDDVDIESDNNSVTPIDTKLESNENLNFVSRSHSKSKVEENIFVTTSQFKALLEIVESVKSRIKDSSETHLRLLDIKSEEDIEYENLRKSFQFIEDKLYEVDSLIFEK